ncbi:UPF0280 family protein [Sneathiella chinensis]|uniref:Uncharacterized protein n=1 Tax=Sneathiella chinensis TaxID=349750 RepID=A0ABQ5U5X7_9PROT|nr:UPF0280 family protein [Sneathiella chinensis]GLQ06633.1 hypothetical protein GCM10007924_18540 [Sneathiella chinensis]
MTQATGRLLEDGRRLHLQHGPIDIIAEGVGPAAVVEQAYDQGMRFFGTILADLVSVLETLRTPIRPGPVPALDGVARSMWLAAHRFSDNTFVTPMAAVAGAVADAVKQAMLAGCPLEKLYANNGGDIALHLSGDALFRSGIVNDPDAPSVDATLTLGAADGVGGIATSGWRGRSLSAGIADAVTVLADTAAHADVAATLIAGAVNVDSPRIARKPARQVRDETDLGDLPVTVQVDPLSPEEINMALDAGVRRAEQYMTAGLVTGVYLSLQGTTRNISNRIIQLGRTEHE